MAVCSFASCSLLLALGRRVLTPPRSPARENGERGGRGGQRESKRFLLQGHPSLFTCFSLSLSLSLFALHPSPPRASPLMKSLFEALASAFARLDGGSSVRSANGCDEFADASGEFETMTTTTTAATTTTMRSSSSSIPPAPATPPSSRGGHYRDGMETCHPLPLPPCSSEGRLTVS